MKFTCTVTIDRPIAKVIELFDNPDNLGKWQDGFVSFEHLSGTPGQPGAKARLVYKRGKREMELIETVTVRNLPHEFSGTYEHEHMTNSMRNRFVEVALGQTRWEAEVEYSEFKALLPKLMSWLLPGMFKKPTQKWMDQFKAFAERQA